jgi:rfaE bifunctional protein nucleotidyltransferase chain/domain/rfaE bifunctional protein kinase chain/domain
VTDRTLVVVGDCLLDVDTVGRASRLSPDGPVPVVQTTGEQVRAGGAGLTAALAARDGGRVVLIAPLADDADGTTLRAALPDGVEVLAVPWSGSTPVKHRIRASGQTVARVDRGGAPGAIGPLPDAVAAALARADAVVVADYGYGTTADPALRTLLAGVARRRPVVWDPHPRGAAPVPGCRLVTPNAVEALGHDPGRRPDVAEVADRALALRDAWQVGTVAVTLGPAGAVVTVGEDGVLAVPAPPVVVADSCGAGDRFAAAAGWALAGGALPTEAVAVAVAAASEFVAAAPAPDGERSGVLVATGGCFDLLHAGHVATLEAARALGDRLVVCVNSDASVARLKGPGRPLQPVQDRARILRALACVDDVVVFEEDTPEQVLRTLRPKLWVKGGDYSGVEVPEAAVLSEWGGRVVTVPFLDGRSTTSLAQRAIARS